MVMKDKLVKTHHKGPYYTMKKISIGLLALASVTFIIAIPTYIMQSNNSGKKINAEETTSEKTETSSEEEVIEYEEYIDQEN